MRSSRFADLSSRTLAGPHQVHGQPAHPARDRLQDVTQKFGTTVADGRPSWQVASHCGPWLAPVALAELIAESDGRVNKILRTEELWNQ